MTIDPRAPTLDELLAHAGWLRGLALRLLRDPHAADDAVQETWLAALRHPPRREVGLRPWLRAVLVNAVRKRGRSEVRRADSERSAGAPAACESPDELLEHAELSAALLREVLSLEPTQRDVVLRRYWRGRTAAEIARERGVPPATVRSQLKRALDALRERMSDRLGGDGERDRALHSIVGLAAPWAAAPTGGVGGALQGAWVVKESSKLAWIGGAVALALAGTWGALGIVREGEVVELRAPDAKLAAAPVDEPEPSVVSRPSEPRRAEVIAQESAPRPAERADVVAEPGEEQLPLVRARVVEALRSPLAGARVELLELDALPGAVAFSAAGGDVELRYEPFLARAYEPLRTVRVEHAGHATRFLLVTLPREGETDLGEIELADGGAVAGRVVDAAGLPIADALVRVAAVPLTHPGHRSAILTPDQARRLGPDVGPGLPSARSGVDGLFRVEGVPPGSGRVWATLAGGRHAFGEPIEVRPRETVTGIELVVDEPTALDRIEGIVVGSDGEPVARAAIHYSVLSSSVPLLQAEADENGRFAIEVRYPEPHDLSFEDPQRESGSAVLRGVEPGTRDLVVRLREARWIDVIGRDESGAPVDFVMDVSGTGHVVSVLDGQVDGEGAGHVRVQAPPEPFRLRAIAKGFPTIERGPFDPDAPPARLELTFESVPGIAGRVLADGEPVAGATVALHEALPSRQEVVQFGFVLRTDPHANASTKTDVEGRFRLVADTSRYGPELLPELEHRLLVEAEGYALADWFLVRLDNATGEEIEIELVRGGTIEGRVLVGSGEDPGSRLVAISRGDGKIRKQRTEPDGSFRFEHVTPGGWQVRVRALETASTRYSIAAGGSPPELEWDCHVLDGRVTVYDVDLRNEAKAKLVGRLRVDGEGAAGWSARVEHVYEYDVVEPIRPVVLDEEGTFVLVAPPGPYKLTISSAEGAALAVHADLALEAPDTAWSFDLETAEVVSSGVVNAGTSRQLHFLWHGERVSVRAEAQVDESGAFPATRVPAGHVSVRRMESFVTSNGFAYEGMRPVLELVLEPGERRAIEVR